MSDPFRVLEIPETADDAAVHQAYLRKVKLCPPDREPQRFQEIRTAFETLRTRRDRLRYRLFRTDPPAPVALLDRDSAARPNAARPDPEQLRQVLLRTLSDASQ